MIFPCPDICVFEPLFRAQENKLSKLKTGLGHVSISNRSYSLSLTSSLTFSCLLFLYSGVSITLSKQDYESKAELNARTNGTQNGDLT